MKATIARTMHKSEDAQRRLIEAASQIFAEVGFNAATVRQITDRAQLNVASVNYHFGDKRQLYRAVLKTVTGRAVSLLEAHCRKGSARDRLRQFVRCLLTAEKGQGGPWAYMIMARETAGLHEEHADLVVEAARPMHRIAESIVYDLCGDSVNASLVKLTASLLVSLCVNRTAQERLDQRLFPEADLRPGDLEQTSEQIYRFVLAGIRELSQLVPSTPGWGT